MSQETKSEARSKKKLVLLIAGIVAAFAAVAVVSALFIFNNPDAEGEKPAQTQGEKTVADTEKEPADSEDKEEIEIILESQMSAEVKTEIDAITGAFLNSVNGRNAALIMDYLTEDFGGTQGQINGFFRTATGNGKSPYTLFGTYYVNNVENPEDRLNVKKTESDTTYASFSAGGEEACIALFLSEGERISQMITIVLTRVDGKMKIAYMDTTDYSYYGKKAPDYFKMAKDAKENGNDALAYVYALMMDNICQPGSALYYDETESMGDFMDELGAWTQENYPKNIVDDKHSIEMIGLALEDVGVVPMIYCYTEVDTAGDGIQADAEKIKDEFLKANPAIAETFTKIVLHISNVRLSETTEDGAYKKIIFEIK